jgi:hypothetical protein
MARLALERHDDEREEEPELVLAELRAEVDERQDEHAQVADHPQTAGTVVPLRDLRLLGVEGGGQPGPLSVGQPLRVGRAVLEDEEAGDADEHRRKALDDEHRPPALQPEVLVRREQEAGQGRADHAGSAPPNTKSESIWPRRCFGIQNVR